jgi:hypothetical protein
MALTSGWEAHLASGLVVYDPARARILSIPPFRYHYLPERASRPGSSAPSVPPPEGIHRPHAPCPFDADDFVAQREIARAERDARTYHLVANRYPVTPMHFLGVRAAAAPGERLCQHLHGPEEVEDMILLLDKLRFPCRVYFNSNRGADLSQSGSSVNHWHFQLFPYPQHRPSAFHQGRVESLGIDEGVRVARVAEWPACHVFVECSLQDFRAAARWIWRRILPIHELNVAYNLELLEPADGILRACLFPRAPGPDVDIPGCGALSSNFGGWELSGDMVIPSSAMMDWIEAHPDEATQITRERLRATTRAVP